ncbi:quercetin 2,3-dioxygenase [Aureococcus anophagefferens]|nr:quercetin 2,3-dioxygenase [Aureococcus anophagefferens]
MVRGALALALLAAGTAAPCFFEVLIDGACIVSRFDAVDGADVDAAAKGLAALLPLDALAGGGCGGDAACAQRAVRAGFEGARDACLARGVGSPCLDVVDASGARGAVALCVFDAGADVAPAEALVAPIAAARGGVELLVHAREPSKVAVAFDGATAGGDLAAAAAAWAVARGLPAEVAPELAAAASDAIAGLHVSWMVGGLPLARALQGPAAPFAARAAAYLGVSEASFGHVAEFWLRRDALFLDALARRLGGAKLARNRGGGAAAVATYARSFDGFAERRPVVWFDGRTVPAPDDSYDVVCFTYVLHHAAGATIKLLREARRVSKRYVVVLEDLQETAADAENAHAHEPLGAFRTREEWVDLFVLLGFSVADHGPCNAGGLAGFRHTMAFWILEKVQDAPPRRRRPARRRRVSELRRELAAT